MKVKIPLLKSVGNHRFICYVNSFLYKRKETKEDLLNLRYLYKDGTAALDLKAPYRQCKNLYGSFTTLWYLFDQLNSLLVSLLDNLFFMSIYMLFPVRSEFYPHLYQHDIAGTCHLE